MEEVVRARVLEEVCLAPPPGFPMTLEILTSIP